MQFQNIRKQFAKAESINHFHNLLEENKNHILVHGLSRSVKSLLLADVYQQTDKNVIFVTGDDKVAENYLDDLLLIMDSTIPCMLPDFEVLPYEERSPHYMIRAQRLQSLTKITRDKNVILSVSLRAFLRKMVTRTVFEKNVKSISLNQEYDLNVLISDLVSNGYQSEYQVTKVGEFAHRGGILDIFSPNYPVPFRIEFFGDEVVSIRQFHIQSQRTSKDDVEEFIIVPMREFSLHDIHTSDDFFWQKIHSNGFYDGIEQDIHCLLPQTENILSFFNPKNTILIWDEFQFTHHQYQEIIEEATELYQKALASSDRNKLIPPQKLFATLPNHNTQVKNLQTCYFSSSFQEHKNIQHELEIHVKNHHNLHGNLEILEKELTVAIEKKYYIIIQSDNSSQRKRMRDLLPTFEDQVHFSIGVLQNGFTFDEAKVAIFTDHEIFSRYRTRKKHLSFSRQDAITHYDDLKPGDYIVHIVHGIGIFEGLKKIRVSENEVECLVISYTNNDRIYVPTYQLSLVSKYVSEEGIHPVIHKLGSRKWENAKQRAKKQIELVAKDILALYAKRKKVKGITFSEDTTWQKEMEESFIHEETDDQLKATQEIKSDMESSFPMERLLCGDVGFGKTEVAISCDL